MQCARTLTCRSVALTLLQSMASTSTRALPAASHRSRLIRHSARLLPHATSRAAAAGRFPDPGATVMAVAVAAVVVVVIVVMLNY